MHVRVIGVGSCHGEDVAGLDVAEAVGARLLPPDVSVALCTRPMPDLLDALEDADVVVIVDAMRSGEPAGTVRRLRPDELARCRDVSCHGFDVSYALEVAKALGRLPQVVEIVGIEVDPPREPGPALAAAAHRAESMVLDLVKAFRGKDLKRVATVGAKDAPEPHPEPRAMRSVRPDEDPPPGVAQPRA